MKRTAVFVVAILAVLFYQCGNDVQKSSSAQEQDTTATVAALPTCQYELDKEHIVLTWTAFKFSEKAPVSGSFDSVKSPLPHMVYEDIKDLLRSSSVEINTRNVRSGNPDRDKKIIDFFFGSFKKGQQDIIHAGIDSVINETQAELRLTMNGVSRTIPATWQYVSDTLYLTTTLNVEEWEAGPSIQQLNKACRDLHKGSDGKSVLWPEVKVQLKAPIKKQCK